MVSMTNSIEINNIKIGEGIPKICVPLTGKSEEEILAQAENIATKKPDLVEWRADFFDVVMDFGEVDRILQSIAKIIAPIPIIFTFRTKKEGSTREISVVDYIWLNESVAKSKAVDLIDVEIFTCANKSSELIKALHQQGKIVIASSHNFEQTPSEEDIIDILQKMESLEADILKVAVMPNSSEDVQRLLGATAKRSKLTNKPLITMAMAKLGASSRVCGEKYGPSVTFASVGQASAPGQIEFDELKKLLQKEHEKLKK